MPENGNTKRPFATGSKPGPDAVDHYLEEQGFYRKHVARDASSLFRAVSEQVFDIQTYHEKIRQDCASFMENHPKDYSNEVDKNFYNYISQLRRSRTHGSLLELRIFATMYRKNVIIFEPTQNLQTTSYAYVSNDAYDNEYPLRVFYSHKDRHFDVIYTMEYVQRLAECQSIVYSILYDNVFKLPDVKYAVERMLHDQNEEVTLPLPHDPSKYKTQAGEIIDFDSSCDTHCVLKDPKTCHFHNQNNFEEIVNEQKHAITVINRGNDNGRMKIFKPIDGFLYDSAKSCVRQLLDEKITPFPYKVAKALDPSIYRNTEFELWSENRKEQRIKWIDSADFSMKHIEDKWMINSDKNRGGAFSYRKFKEAKFEQGVVDESEYMALDDEMKKKYVILDHGSIESFKHLMGLSYFIPSRDQLDLTVMPMNGNYRGGFKKGRGGGRFNSNTHQSNQPGNQQMLRVNEIEHDFNYQRREQCEQQHSGQGNYHESELYEQQASTTMYQQVPTQNWNQHVLPHVPQQQMHFQQIMPYGNFSVPPPTPVLLQPVGVSNETSLVNGDTMNLMIDSDLSSTSVNWKPKESTDKNGSDLPCDVETLQFYYNLGVRYFLAAGVQRRLENVASQLESMELRENQTTINTNSAVGSEDSNQNLNKEAQSNSLKSDNTEPPAAPANTPVGTKIASGNQGGNHGGGNSGSQNRYHNAHGNMNFRRATYQPNRDGRDHRDGRDNRDGGYRNYNRNHKEIKFNSNVKNAPKSVVNSSSSYASIVKQPVHTGTSPPVNAVPSPNVNPLDKSQSTALSANQYSPVSDVSAHQPLQCDQMYQPQQPYLQQVVYPQQQVVYPQQQVVYYQQMEDGQFVMQQQAPFQFIQPCQYPVPPPQVPGHVCYPLQGFQPQSMDGSLISSNDSGVVDVGMLNQPQQIQYYQGPQQAVPMFYAQSSMPQTPQITTIFPFPQTSGQIHRVNSAPPSTMKQNASSTDHSPRNVSDGADTGDLNANVA